MSIQDDSLLRRKPSAVSHTLSTKRGPSEPPKGRYSTLNGCEISKTDDDSLSDFDKDDLVFSIPELRLPTWQLNRYNKKRLKKLKSLHNKIDEEFLEKRIEPRLIMFISEDLGTN
jgi:hypothetical protein